MSDHDLPTITIVYSRSLTVFTPFASGDTVLSALIDTLEDRTHGHGIAQPIELDDIQADVLTTLESPRTHNATQRLEEAWLTLHGWLNPDFSRR